VPHAGVPDRCPNRAAESSSLPNDNRLRRTRILFCPVSVSDFPEALYFFLNELLVILVLASDSTQDYYSVESPGRASGASR
jgi:hypothetical protein